MSSAVPRSPACKSSALEKAELDVDKLRQQVKRTLGEYKSACVAANLAAAKLDRIRHSEQPGAILVDESNGELSGEDEPAAAADSIQEEIARVEAETADLKRRHAELAAKLGVGETPDNSDEE